MFDLKHAKLEEVVIHRVGNKLKDEGVVISRGTYSLADEKIGDLLQKYFLSSFKNDIFYSFTHETELSLNEIYIFVSRVFISRPTFYEQSVNILKHLYEKSNHPKIKSGEFYMAYLTNCTIDEKTVDAIGIFKSENKDTFLKINQKDRDFNIDYEKGINVNKLDKGCIIFNTQNESGFKVLIVDAINRNENEALYWKDEFLKLTEVQDEHFHTKAYLDLCKDFSENIFGTIHNADKKDQVVFINNSLNYFTQKKEFDLDDFAQEVVKDPQCIKDFKEYKKAYDDANGLVIKESFKVSSNAVRDVKRKFRSLIKLDTDVEIKLINTGEDQSSNRFIERGFDEHRRMFYYKVYFNNEE